MNRKHICFFRSFSNVQEIKRQGTVNKPAYRLKSKMVTRPYYQLR
jgi:hypothetical protein